MYYFTFIFTFFAFLFCFKRFFLGDVFLFTKALRKNQAVKIVKEKAYDKNIKQIKTRHNMFINFMQILRKQYETTNHRKKHFKHMKKHEMSIPGKPQLL